MTQNYKNKYINTNNILIIFYVGNAIDFIEYLNKSITISNTNDILNSENIHYIIILKLLLLGYFTFTYLFYFLFTGGY